MVRLYFVQRSYVEREVWPPPSRIVPVLEGSMEQIEDYAALHKLAWVVSTSIADSDLKDHVVYRGYWIDSAGNVFVPM